MCRISINDPHRRTITIVAALVLLPLIALVPAYLALQFIGEPKTVDYEIAQSITVADPVPELDGATVMLNPSVAKHLPTHLPMYSAEIIRNGVLVREDSVQQVNSRSLGPAEAPIFTKLSTYGDECETILSLYADEIAEQFPGWRLVAVVDENSTILPKCSIRRVATKE